MIIVVQGIPQKYSFKYYRSKISKKREIEDDFKHRIRARWLMWRIIFWVLCGRHILTRIEGKILLDRDWTSYDIRKECRVILLMRKISLTYMKTLRWMYDKCRKCRIKVNECIQEHFGIISKVDKLKETLLK